MNRTALILGLVVASFASSAHASLDFGNDLIGRTYASDYPVGLGGTAPILVMPDAVLPNGTLESFKTFNQLEPGGSPFASAGNTFTAYVLRPTGNPNEFTVVFSSAPLIVPAVAASGIETFPVAPFAVQAGDRIGFAGQGVPVDITALGTDILSYPTGPAPTLASTITLGSGDFPIYPQNRLYSFAASVTPVPEPTTVLAGLLLLLPFGLQGLRAFRSRN